MLRILIADGHEIVRRGVRHLVELHPGWEVCGETADGREALELALRLRPDVLILDTSTPTMNGSVVTRHLGREAPNVRVLFYTMHDDDETISGGLAAGARGFLLKTDSMQQLESAIATIGARKTYFSARVLDFLQDAAMNVRKHSRLESFTLRELEIGQLVAEGYSNKRIAVRLGISNKTVESHRAAAMRKAGVRTAAAFVRFAIKQSLIQA